MESRKVEMRYIALFFVCSQLLFSGCGAETSHVVGGTAGSLTAGEVPIPDFEIKVYKTGSTVPLGLGTTGKDGKFQLVEPKGVSPLWLAPGEYVFTLESLGPVPPPLSPAYMNATKTPLKVNWKAVDKSLDLKVPAFK